MHFIMVDLEPIVFQKTGSLMLGHVSSNALSKRELRKYYNEKNEEQTNPSAWQVSKRFQVSIVHNQVRASYDHAKAFEQFLNTNNNRHC
jgi:hypothetical protein